MSKLKNLKKVHDNAISVTTDFVGFYPCILLNENLEVLKKQLDNFCEKSIPTWRISFSKMNKFSLGFGSGTLLVNNASEKELDVFLEQRNNFHPNLKFRHKHSREEINFFDVTIRVNHGEFMPVSTANLLMAISTFTLSHVTLVTQNLQLILVSL